MVTSCGLYISKSTSPLVTVSPTLFTLARSIQPSYLVCTETTRSSLCARIPTVRMETGRVPRCTMAVRTAKFWRKLWLTLMPPSAVASSA